ncbi:MAG: glycoside hydrolase family 28 protein [Clostridia bacterium]|nr:glycoside hydrolase family 28 protein [Clostridia bacterium]
MINTVIFNDEIKVWWDYVKLSTGEIFKVLLNGVEVGCTRKSHYNISGLTENTKYKIKVEKISIAGKLVAVIGENEVFTLNTKKRIDVTKPPYNAIPDGKTLNTLAIQKAINDCKHDECVYFPDGIYLTGALDLKSDLELYLSNDAIVQGSIDEKDYLPKITSRFEGCEELCYRSLLNAGNINSNGETNCQNITIRGGKIWGGGQKLRINTINAEKYEVLKYYGLENEINPGYYYESVLPGRTRGRLFGFNNVKNVVVANCELGNSPSWNLHFTYCKNIVTCSSKISSHRISNGDGIDPDSSKNCVIFDVEFNTGDDCIAIKSGKNLEGYLVGRPCENIRIFDILVKDGHGIAIGSEMSGGVKDVKIWNCKILAGTGIYFKSSEKRGGYIKNISISNCHAPTISISMNCSCNIDGEPAPKLPEIKDIVIEDVSLTGVNKFTGEHERVEPDNAITICGLDERHQIENVILKNVTLKYRQMIPNQIMNLFNVKNVTLENIFCLGEI